MKPRTANASRLIFARRFKISFARPEHTSAGVRLDSDKMCLKYHISYEHIANQTDYLVRNPHLNHWPEPACRTCHVSHGEQIDYCSECDDMRPDRPAVQTTQRAKAW